MSETTGAAVLGEFVGTLVLILLGNGVVAGVVLKGTKAESAGWLAITTGWALAVFSGVAVSISIGDADAHLNPAFTVASVMMTGHAERLWTYIPAQILGAITGAVLVWLVYLPHWAITEERANKLGCFATIPAIRRLGANLVSEIIGTFVLVLVASALVSKRLAPGGVAPGLGPLLVGGVVWSVGLSLGATTGYAINPARDLGPRLAHAFLPIPGKGSSDWSYASVPILGPIVGGNASRALYKLDWYMSVIAFAGLLLLWLVFAAQVSMGEVLLGATCSALAIFASVRCFQLEPLLFKPRLRWLIEAWQLPIDIVKDFRVVFRVFFLRLARKPVPGVFRRVSFKCAGNDAHSGAKRALALLYLSVSPNSVVVGIDDEKKYALLHQLLPGPISPIKRKLEEKLAMDFWSITAMALLICMVPPFLVALRGDAVGRLVGLEAGVTVASILCLVLTEQFHRVPFVDIALALALLSFGSGLVFTRFLERWL